MTSDAQPLILIFAEELPLPDAAELLDRNPTESTRRTDVRHETTDDE